MQHYLGLLGLVLPTIVTGFALFERSPKELEARRQPTCTPNAIIAAQASIVLHDQYLLDGGASFCLSVLQISTSTVTLTSTTSTSTASTVLTTHHGTVTVKPTTITSTITTTTRTAECEQHPILRREAGIEERAPAKNVMTACLCFNFPQPKITVTTSIIRTTTTKTTTTLPITRTITPTIKTTTTLTVTKDQCPLPTTCSNTGVQYAYYAGQGTYPFFDVSNLDASYAAYLPENLKGLSPIHSGVTDILSIPNNGPATFSFPDSIATYPGDYYTIEYKFYVYAPVTGTYTFTATGVDDIVLLWSGATAYSGWTRANAATFAVFNDGPAPNPSFGAGSTVLSGTLTAGTYTPIRIAYANGGGGSGAGLTITAPGNHVILGPNSPASVYIVQYSCDRTTAPKFASWKKET